jgi:hypothetical protein
MIAQASGGPEDFENGNEIESVSVDMVGNLVDKNRQ